MTQTMGKDKIMILDGAMGTMLQRRGLTGNCDMFNITNPDDVAAIHRAYIEAGADIIETNTFNSNRISQAEYGCMDKVTDMALAGAAIARREADRAGRKVLVAGSIGPTSKSLSMSTDGNPLTRPVSFDEMSAAYREEIDALIEGGVDMLLIETCIDALNAKAAIYNIPDGFPVMISASCADRSGRLLTGQTVEAFYHSVKHCNLYSFGLNCSFGATEMLPLISEVSHLVREDRPSCRISCYPNAGLPNELGQYDQTPEVMGAAMKAIAEAGLADIVGGCCGTTPEHIRAISAAVSHIVPPVHIRESSGGLVAAGLEPVLIDRKKTNFTNIGERTNVAGSRKFAKLIAAGDYAAGIEIAARQIENGASVIDINMDDAMLDSAVEMERFVRCIATEPSVAKAALMIDSSHWDTILAGLKNAQGKCIVNSISLKEGEREFLRKAAEIRKFGAAVVVMAFDEQGQATDFESKIRICRRAYSLLTEAGTAPEDIIFDANVLTVGTGTGTDRRYGIDFIEAVRWIKNNLPGALTSGGISNLSFAFRGNNPVREAMHSVFLYHAVRAGLDMAIVNPGMLRVYDDMDPVLRKACEDVILDTDPDATDRLVEIAAETAADAGTSRTSLSTRKASAPDTLQELLIKGSSEGLPSLITEAVERLGSAQAVIQGPLMEGMETVGEYFGEGKMFLPQVVKSAGIMKEAVELLQPYMDAEAENTACDSRPAIVMATVKGDVHDIGKNITDTVLSCNGFRVIDLGVMVDKETILETAVSERAAMIGVSGLITPSLFQMEELCREMNSRGMDIPLLVGGATTSSRHTAIKLAPLYPHVFHGADASATAVMAKKCIMDRQAFEEEEHSRQSRFTASGDCGRPAEGEKLFSYLSDDGYADFRTMASQEMPVRDIPLEEVIPLVNWDTFYTMWEIRKSDRDKAAGIRKDAESLLERLPCSIRGAVHFTEALGRPLGLFAASVHSTHAEGCPCEFCRSNAIMEKSLRLCLAEAASEWIGLHLRVPDGFKSIRPGIGYPSCPDHRLKKTILEMIPDSELLGISLTESYAMLPESSVCGFVVFHKDARYL